MTKAQKLQEKLNKGVALTAKQITAQTGLKNPWATISRLIKGGANITKTYTTKKVKGVYLTTAKYQIAQ
jgi:hypothetical protein